MQLSRAKCDFIRNAYDPVRVSGICQFYLLSFDAIARTLNVRAALLPFRAHKMQFVEGYDVTAPAY